MNTGELGYFDYAASCPAFPEVLEEFARVSAKLFGNPSSIHDAGQAARELLDEGKRQLAALCGIPSARVILTSGGTEANNLVIRGVMDSQAEGRLLLAADVHESAWSAKDIYPDRTDMLPTGRDGRIDPKQLRRRSRPRTVLLSALHGNNETGVIHDAAAIGKICVEKGVLFHCDGVQALGHVPVDLGAAPCDFYTFSAHKFGGPRGVGGVLMRDAELAPQLTGGGQEYGLRAGTENVAGFTSALVALRMSLGLMETEIPRLRRLTHILVAAVQEGTPSVIARRSGSFERIVPFLVNSDIENGLPGVVSLSFPGLVGQSIATELNLRGFAVSSGSACHSGDVEPSRVILAMGRSKREALGTVRISMGRCTREEEVRALASVLAEVVERQRALS